MSSRPCSPARIALCALGLALGASAAHAATDSELATAQARYKKDVAVCNEGRSNQDRATCMKEAGAALEEAKRGRLSTDPVTRANATARCEALKGDERDACIARMNGAGTVEGSAQSGGILRELVTPEPAAPATPPAPAKK
jgi:hypothetical protein